LERPSTRHTPTDQYRHSHRSVHYQGVWGRPIQRKHSREGVQERTFQRAFKRGRSREGVEQDRRSRESVENGISRERSKRTLKRVIKRELFKEGAHERRSSERSREAFKGGCTKTKWCMREWPERDVEKRCSREGLLKRVFKRGIQERAIPRGIQGWRTRDGVPESHSRDPRGCCQG
jgi:hypothetical protein